MPLLCNQSAHLIASRARAMRLCRALNTSMPALLTSRVKQMENQSTTSQPWTVTRSINVSMNAEKTLECGSWNIRVNTSVMRFNSTELHTTTITAAHQHTVTNNISHFSDVLQLHRASHNSSSSSSSSTHHSLKDVLSFLFCLIIISSNSQKSTDKLSQNYQSRTVGLGTIKTVILWQKRYTRGTVEIQVQDNCWD